MSLVRAAFGRRSNQPAENAALPLSTSNLVLTRNRRTPTVTEDRALAISAYWRAMSLLSGTLAALSWKVYKSGTRQRVRQRTILDNPTPRQTPFEWMQTQFLHVLGHGNAYSLLVRNGAGVVVQAWPVHPSRVQPRAVAVTPDNPGGMLYKIRLAATNEDNADAGGYVHEIEFTSFDVAHLQYMSFDGIVGKTPLRAWQEALGSIVATDDAAAEFAANGNRLSGYLTVEGELNEEDDEAGAIRRYWRRFTTGPQHAGDVVVLPKSTKFTPLAISPQDAELLTTRKFSVQEIARMFGLPPHMLGDVEGSTSWGTGIEQQQIGFTNFTLLPLITLTQQRWTRQLLPGGWTSGAWFVEADLNSLLRGDMQSRFTAYGAGIKDGWLTRNEVRQRENLEPLDGADDLIAPSNMTLISVDGSGTVTPLSAKGVSQ